VFRNILVPIDGSAVSRRATKLAMRLAHEQKARVTGFYAGLTWTPRLYGDSVLAGKVTPAQHANIVRNTASRHFGVMRREAAAEGVPCRYVHVMGDFPCEEIIKVARRFRNDLIVMGSHGRRGISKLLLGSQTNMVLAHSKIPVMVVR